DLSYDGICDSLAMLFPQLGPNFTATYKDARADGSDQQSKAGRAEDDEGDDCTLCSDSLRDFLEVSKQ
ncbi:unnamed protein product, partial [Effrenium voratum]